MIFFILFNKNEFRTHVVRVKVQPSITLTKRQNQLMYKYKIYLF